MLEASITPKGGIGHKVVCFWAEIYDPSVAEMRLPVADHFRPFLIHEIFRKRIT
jgi:hypothetical protein